MHLLFSRLARSSKRQRYYSRTALAVSLNLSCLLGEPPVHVGTSRYRKALRLLRRVNPSRRRMALALWLILPVLVGCTSGFPHPESPSTSQPPSTPTTVSVSPTSVIVAAGSTTSFIAVFTPSLPSGGSLSWAVNAPAAGTISSTGMYTASVTPGNYTVTATWTPSVSSAGTILSASAAVQVLPVPQQSIVINPVITQATGAVQTASGGVQNAGIARQEVPWMSSQDSSGRVQVQSGFVIPVLCAGTTTVCP